MKILIFSFFKGPENFEVDEHPRETNKESLSKLPPLFKKGGVVTAGNASVSWHVFSFFLLKF